MSAAEQCKTLLNDEVTAVQQAHQKMSQDLEVIPQITPAFPDQIKSNIHPCNKLNFCGIHVFCFRNPKWSVIHGASICPPWKLDMLKPKSYGIRKKAIYKDNWNKRKM